jgi:hypothetical protein
MREENAAHNFLRLHLEVFHCVTDEWILELSRYLKKRPRTIRLLRLPRTIPAASRTENLRIAPVWMNSSAWILLVSTIIMREDARVRLFEGADVDGDRFFTNRHHCI